MEATFSLEVQPDFNMESAAENIKANPFLANAVSLTFAVRNPLHLFILSQVAQEIIQSSRAFSVRGQVYYGRHYY